MNPGSGTRNTAGLYIHVPFCSFVCPYCDFAVSRLKSGEVRAWVEHVLLELKQPRDFTAPIDTIYFGGGTPSLLSSEDVSRILQAAGESLNIERNVRLHFEVNPEDASPDYLRSLAGLGVSFLSLGIQSLRNRHLRFLGRRHGEEDARHALHGAVESGFHTVSVDLMFGLPEQDEEEWRQDLQEVAASGARHVSCYQLNIKPDTLFERKVQLGRLKERSDRDQGQFFHITHNVLEALGFHAYEVSNFAAAPGHRSVHNQKYWDHSPFLGIGPGAHSWQDGRRWWNHREFQTWRSALDGGRSVVAGEEVLTRDQLALEVIMLSLRQPRGLCLNDLEQRFGIDLALLAKDKLDKFQEDGLLRHEDGYLRPSVRGLAVADALAADLGYFL